MTIEIKSVGNLDASLVAPPSKAHTLRALFISSLADGKSILKNALFAEDQLLAADALRSFGAKISRKGNDFIVEGNGGVLSVPKKRIFAGNSGLTLRFLLSYASLCPKGKTVITGSERMKQRPASDLISALHQLGIKTRSLSKKSFIPLEISANSFEGGKATMDGSKSSQYISAILLSAPYAKSDIELHVKGNLASKPYVDITLEVMRSFGVYAAHVGYEKFAVISGQRYVPKHYEIEGDYSSSSFFFSGAAICNGKVKVSNLNPHSLQGDKHFLSLLEKMGCSVSFSQGCAIVEGTSKLKPLGKIDMQDYPDIVLPLAVTGAFAKGKTTISNISHLRIKESDRIASAVRELKRIGAKARATKNAIIIEGNGGKNLHGAEIETYNDHRVAMSFAVAGLKLKGMKIKNEECVQKSFPDFFKKLSSL